MESPLTSQRLSALTVRSWVTLLGNASLLNIRQTEKMEVTKRELCPLKIQTQKLLVSKDSKVKLTGQGIYDDPILYAMVALNGIEEDDRA
ncbi:hypothetical protein Tco_1509649 [Tanacetum coccineum]